MLAPTHRGLAPYLVAAVLARGADAGAGIGLLLLCVDPVSRLDRPVLTGSLLVTALTAPHLLGPVLARPLDRLGDTRRVLAAAMAGYGVLLAAATAAQASATNAQRADVAAARAATTTGPSEPLTP